MSFEPAVGRIVAILDVYHGMGSRMRLKVKRLRRGKRECREESVSVNQAQGDGTASQWSYTLQCGENREYW